MSPELEVPFGFCEHCEDETEVLNILPIKRANGSLITLTCTPCAEKTSAFCKEHERPHMGFDDESTACRLCINERVEAEWEEVSESFFKEVNSGENREEILTLLDEWNTDASRITHQPLEKNLARAVITRSERLHVGTDKVIKQACEEGAAIIVGDPKYWRSLRPGRGRDKLN